MKQTSERWPHRLWSAEKRGRRTRFDDLTQRTSGAATTEIPMRTTTDLARNIPQTAFAFRGYDVANMGRSRELLLHPRYGSIVRDILTEVSKVSADTLHRPFDLTEYVRAESPSTLAGFPEDVSLIVAMELAQLKILEQCFDVEVTKAKLSIGYSIGELTAMIIGGIYTVDQILPVPLAMAPDCAELAENTTMGVFFTREPVLEEQEVLRVCRMISAEGHGLIGPSAFLSPNTALILAEGPSFKRLEELVPQYFPGKVVLKKNPNRWPPLHSPIVWKKNVPNRTAVAMYKLAGGNTIPHPPIVSCVTGKISYGLENSRDLMIRWCDHPQRLWDAIDTTLHSGVEAVIHIGPAPNLIPATFSRLSNNVTKHIHSKTLQKLGHDVVTSMNRSAWLGHILPAKASLLRAPFIEHIILEDWLLSQPVA